MNLKNTFIAFILFVSTINCAMAQHRSPIVLSKYTYTEADTVVGKIIGEAGMQFKLKGSSAKVFTLQGDILSIRPSFASSSKEIYEIQIDGTAASGTVTSNFKVVKDNFIRNKVIAHRGAWKNTGAAENSILALKNAISLGCQGSEFDVHMSADSVLVVSHDPVIQGLNIASSSEKQLGALKLSSGERMPTLESYLKAGMDQNATRLVLEIKPTTDSERALQLARNVVKLVWATKSQAWIDYISFDYEICKEVLRLDPYAHVAYLNGDKSPAQLKADGMWGYDYHFNVLKKNEPWIEQAREAGLTTNVWTVNDQEMLQWFLDRKIDFITTNEPELLLKMVSK